MKWVFLLWFIFFSSLFGALGISNPQQYFSPNLDGEKDLIKIPLKIKEENLIEWKVLILEKANSNQFKVVKTIQSENPKKQNLNFKKFFKRIFAKEKIITDLNSINWDGKDQEGNSLPDGIYYFKIFAEDKFGNRDESKFIPIILDTLAPQVDFKISEKIFSPNGDKRKDELIIDINIMEFNEFDKWKLAILNQNNQEVFKQEGEKNILLKWKGEKNKKKPLNDGNYKIKILAYDLANNKSLPKEREVVLVTTFETAKLIASREIISPNNDGFFDTLTFKNKLSSLKRLSTWALEIYDQNNKKVRKLNPENTFVEEINFAGLDQNNKQLKDGVYQAIITADYDSGNLIKSNPVKIKIDTTPPALNLKLNYYTFTPFAQDSGNKKLSLVQKARGEKNDTYKAIIKNDNGEIVYTKDFGTNLPEKFEWDGNNFNREKISGNYTYTLTGEDNVANIAILESKPFKLITEKIKVSFKAVNSSFSPNQDKRLDKVNFKLSINQVYKKIFERGEIQIIDKNKKIVKTIPVSKFKENWQWDGLDNKNQLLKDDKYFYSFMGKFSNQQKFSTPKRTLYLDTTPIDLIIKTKNLIFSPNGDGNLDTLEIENILTPSQLKKEEDKFTLKIKNQNNRIFKKFKWQGKIPRTVIWSGKDKNKKVSPENFYVYEIVTIDHAQNEKTYQSKPFQLIIKIEKVEVTLDQKLISQKKLAKLKNIVFTPQVSTQTGLIKVEYTLNKENVNFNQLLKRQKDLTPFTLNLENQKILPSDIYTLNSQFFFNSGNQPVTQQEIYIDNSNPSAKIITQPALFSPDNDGKNEILSIRFTAKDNHALEQINSWIFRKVEFSKGKKSFEQTLDNYLKTQIPLRKWKWAGKSKQMFNHLENWNGTDDRNNKVESATEYLILTRVEDKVGLVTIETSSFLVDILVNKLPDGRLRIILNNINFEFDSDKMIGNYQRTLALLIKMLNKFPNYKIEIIGHTDSRGTEEYNQALSIKRAKKVYQFLSRKGGIKRNKINYVGVGESQLLIENEVNQDNDLDPIMREQLTEENYRKNRRVEFFLKKQEE